MDPITRLIHTASVAVASIVMIAMMAMVAVDVAMRSFIGAGFPATAEIVSRYFMVALSLLPLALTQIEDRHIEVSIFTDRLSPAKRRINRIFCLCASLAAFGLLGWFTLFEAIHKTQLRAYVEAGTLQVPTWPSYWIPPISAALMVIVLILQISGQLMRKKDI